jgi:hypothetical protein
MRSQDEAAAARLGDGGAHAARDGERDVVGGGDGGDLGLGERRRGAHALLVAQRVHDGPRERHAPVHQRGEQLAVAGEQDAAEAREVAALVDDRAPLLAALPEAVVRGVGAEHEQEAERDADERVRLVGDLELVPVVVRDGGADGDQDAQKDAREDLAHHRALDVEEVAEPVVSVVVDHRITNSVRGAVA